MVNSGATGHTPLTPILTGEQVFQDTSNHKSSYRLPRKCMHEETLANQHASTGTRNYLMMACDSSPSLPVKVDSNQKHIDQSI